MPSTAIVDANILYAAIDMDDRWHERALTVLGRRDLSLVIPALIIAEVCHLVERRMGPVVEARFLESLSAFDVRLPEPDDWPRIAELVRQCSNFPLGGADASIVALAERLETDTIITLDHRHFATIRPRHCQTFRLLPE